MQKINFETHPDQYLHWRLNFDGSIARLTLDVKEDGGLGEGYSLKLNSYDLGVDIELADAIQRIRFEHPEVKVVVVDSGKDRMFCAGANIYMLGSSIHGFKVNFCKFTNETRLGIEDASRNSGLKFLAAVNGVCAGGGYELALACDEIVLVDDGSSAVSLPEVPLLGVLPGTGGLTRVIDKRHVRRDRADVFSTLSEGIRGKRAVEWRLVDAVAPRSSFDQAVAKHAEALAAQSDRPGGTGITLNPLTCERGEDAWTYEYVTVQLRRDDRIAEVTVRTPEADVETTPDAILAAGDKFWPLAVFRQLDDAMLNLRFNEVELGTWVIRTEGDASKVLAADAVLKDQQSHWAVREITNFIKRTLKRLDLSARSLIALVEPGSCFAGTFLELMLAADRSYMLDDPDRPNALQLSWANDGVFTMSNGLSRLQTRFYGDEAGLERVLAEREPIAAVDAEALGLVTFAPDDIDWEDEVRIAVEERASLSPDALTGMEANLRFVGPETLETKIFGRLSAWQNWIFQRPNAVGERGALKVYGSTDRPEFDWQRT